MGPGLCTMTYGRLLSERCGLGRAGQSPVPIKPWCVLRLAADQANGAKTEGSASLVYPRRCPTELAGMLGSNTANPMVTWLLEEARNDRESAL
jgi:hypothetical protein